MDFVSLSIKNFINIFLLLLPLSVFGQQTVYENPPAFILKHSIKRITQIRNSVYHEKKKVEADSMQMSEFNEKGLEVFSTSYVNNERYFWNKIEYDSQNRVIKTARYNANGFHDASEFNYLPNGDYIQKFYRAESPDQFQFYKYFFDAHGNEIRREEWNNDSLVINWDEKTYNEYDRILSRVHQLRKEDTVVYTRYYYKQDTILKRKDFYHKGELTTRINYEFFPDGKEKAMHEDKKNSWYSFYDDQGRLSQQMIVRHPEKDTIYNDFTYDENGLIYSTNNHRKNLPQRREVYTYEAGKERTKTIYTRANTFNALFETVYFGDTALVVYQTPYWKNKAVQAHYKRLDSHGNVVAEVQGKTKGTKQPLYRWMRDAQPVRYHFEYSKTGKVLAKYQVASGWSAEAAFCRSYTDPDIVKGMNRSQGKEKYASCDTIKTRKFMGGKHYWVSLNSNPNLTRHIYENKNGVVDSILDINKAGTILNRMVKEDDVYLTYFLTNRYEYNELDSLQKVFKSFGDRYYTSSENMTEEHFWRNGRKVKTEQFMNHWGNHSSKNKTTITYDYQGTDVLKSTKDPQGKIKEELMKYDENGRLIQIMNLDRTSNGAIQINFTYDTNGNLSERTEVAIMNPVEILFKYDFH